VLLVGGADLLVRGAARLAASFGISPLVVGLTVVAVGTSAPELAVSLEAAFSGHAELSVGNVVGSNILNVLLVMGGCALIAPLVVEQKLVRRDVPIMVVASVALLALAWNGRLGPLEGAVLLIGFAAYVVFVIRQSRAESRAVALEYERQFGVSPLATRTPLQKLRDAVLAGAGMGLLVWGAHWMVDSAVGMARAMGVSDAVLGLTLVAAGTSVPEAATSLVATVRGERDIAAGNVVGSNLFNILWILGVSSLVAPGGLSVAPAILRVDLPVMIAVAAACLPITFWSYRMNRWAGLLFLAYYAAYTTWIVLHATEHDALPQFSAFMLSIALPLTGISLGVIGFRAARRRAAAT
jgi:cation:H+ antiporter